ncbi:MAG: hypothetical protein KME04_19690 [Pleurocapsa minor GSE-CHR-MK-17-07R]|jgi:hypothetical protein|nr:hypothetical protein [Pleurocapsa minor GSE-CHR-MK 17-07R]
MAKKQDKKSQQREFDPRFDDPNDDDGMMTGDPFTTSSSSGGLAERARASSGRRTKSKQGIGVLGIIGGFIQVILNALLLLVLLAVLGIGGVYLAQSFGLIDPPAASSASLLGIPPLIATPAPAPEALTDSAGIDSMTDSAGIDSMTDGDAVDTVCAAPLDWWNTVSASFESIVISYAPLYFSPGQSISETLDTVRGARDIIANAAADDCALPLRETVLAAVDAQINAIVTLQNADRAGSNPQARIAAAQFASIYDLLWETGLNTSPESPINQNVSRGGGECPGLPEWNAQIAPLLAAFEATLLPVTDPTIDPATAGPAADSARLISAQIVQLTAPPCAAEAQNQAVITTSRLADGVLGYLSGQADASSASVDYARASVLLDAWLRWLGLTTA